LSADCSGGTGDSGAANIASAGTNGAGDANIATTNGNHSRTVVRNSQHHQGTSAANGTTGRTGNSGTGVNFITH
jgi:hypothetical protein